MYSSELIRIFSHPRATSMATPPLLISTEPAQKTERSCCKRPSLSHSSRFLPSSNLSVLRSPSSYDGEKEGRGAGGGGKIDVRGNMDHVSTLCEDSLLCNPKKLVKTLRFVAVFHFFPLTYPSPALRLEVPWIVFRALFGATASPVAPTTTCSDSEIELAAIFTIFHDFTPSSIGRKSCLCDSLFPFDPYRDIRRDASGSGALPK